MDEQNVADTAAALEPTLLYGGSKVALGMWIGLAGILAGGLGGVTLSPAIREPLPFLGFLVSAALLLRGLHPATVRFFGSGATFPVWYAFFWAAALGISAVLSARIDSALFAYSAAIMLGAFVGMMYGSFPPGAVRDENVWMVAFLIAPFSSSVSTYLLRYVPGALDSLTGALGAGALAGGLLMLPMGVILGRLWDEAHGFAEVGMLYLHNEAFAPKAVAYLDRAIAAHPRKARYFSLRALALSRMNEPGRASADWDTACALAPDDPEPYFHRGIELLRRGALSEAVASLDAAAGKDASFAEPHRHLGAAYERLGDVTRAFEHYDRAIALASDDAAAFADRAAAHFRGGDLERALRDAERAIRLDARRGAAYVTRGRALARLGRWEEARQSFEEAIDLNPEPAVHEDALRGLESVEARVEHERS